MSGKRSKLSSIPKTLSSSFKLRISSALLDCSMISNLTYFTIMAAYGMNQAILGEYTGAESIYHLSFPLLLLAYIPIYYLVAISYYYVSYRRSRSQTVGNTYLKTCIVASEFVLDEDNRNFQLTNDQALRRSLGSFIASMTFFLLNLTALVDPYGRSFTDHFSGTMTITQDEFYQLFTTKVSCEYQVVIDVDLLETAKLVEDTSVLDHELMQAA